jgi:hypothetical protein
MLLEIFLAYWHSSKIAAIDTPNDQFPQTKNYLPPPKKRRG